MLLFWLTAPAEIPADDQHHQPDVCVNALMKSALKVTPSHQVLPIEASGIVGRKQGIPDVSYLNT